MFRRWISAQYNDIKGNAKWALLTVLWAIMVDVAKSLLRLVPHIHNWEIWAIILVASFLAFIFLARTQSDPALPAQQKNQTTAESSLRAQALQLGLDLFAFLREVGPDPGNLLAHLHSEVDVWRRMSEKTGPYIERVHHGYLSRFKDRVVKMFHELAIKGIEDNEIEDWDIDPPQAVKPESVRRIAEHMFIIVARLDIKEASKGT